VPLDTLQAAVRSLPSRQRPAALRGWFNETRSVGAQQPQAAQKQEVPSWAKPEGLAPDAKRPGFTIAGDPYSGNPDARLAAAGQETIFSDVSQDCVNLFPNLTDWRG
jgi:hypothetical protein